MNSWVDRGTICGEGGNSRKGDRHGEENEEFHLGYVTLRSL